MSEPSMTAATAPGVVAHIATDPDGTLTIALSGRLDVTTTGGVWRQAMDRLAASPPARVVLDATGLDYADVAGIGLILELGRRAKAGGAGMDLRGLKPELAGLLPLFDAMDEETTERRRHKRGLAAELGKAGVDVWRDIVVLVSFVGEAGVAVASALANPRTVRWKDTWHVAEAVGVNGLLIIALIGFLMGLIMSFQSAVPLRQFGAEIYVANLLGLSMLRELGPLVTAILVAGRSGSAFAAELGTMKINEELNALETMGLDPVRFLVVTRMLAAMLMTPLLTVFFDVLGLIGGGVVMVSLGFPPVTYMTQVFYAVHMTDFVGGLVKALVFAILVSGIGCLRGLQTKTGASAVGDSTTSAVVSAIVLISVMDGIFAVMYFALGL
jgi:phospholipid/cholesterol/gamma-HCH transport system permease protein